MVGLWLSFSFSHTSTHHPHTFCSVYLEFTTFFINRFTRRKSTTKSSVINLFLFKCNIDTWPIYNIHSRINDSEFSICGPISVKDLIKLPILPLMIFCKLVIFHCQTTISRKNDSNDSQKKRVWVKCKALNDFECILCTNFCSRMIGKGVLNLCLFTQCILKAALEKPL